MDAANDLLPWYLNGTLDSTERAVVEAHLGGCAVCRQELSELSELAEAMAAHAGGAAAKDREALKPGRTYRPAAFGWAIAASVVLVSALGIVAILRRGPALPPPAAGGDSVVMDLGSGPTRSTGSPAELKISTRTRRVELSFLPPIDGPNDYELSLVGPDQSNLQSWERGSLALDGLGRVRLPVEVRSFAHPGDYHLLVRQFGQAGEARDYSYPFTVILNSN